MNFYEKDELLQDILKESLDDELFSWADKQLREFGALCATEIDERAAHTDREGQPRLIKYNRFGEDQSYVWLNEGYKKTVEETYGRGIVGYVHKEIPDLGKKGNYLYSFAQGYLLSQTEPGFYCPVTLTMATAYLLDRYADSSLKEKYLPHVASTGEEELYEGATFLTERQGGSDVGANETKAILDNGVYRLYGEKYFASNAGACGVATVLARKEGASKGTKGLSLFLVPWRKEDGGIREGISIRRLKDKLGVRAVPSAEVVFEGAEAFQIGEGERGFYYMMEALNLSRICNAVASIGIMRRAYSEAFQYATERNAFGNILIQYPMVQDTLVELCVKLEAEVISVFELVKLYDDWCTGGSTKEKDGLLRLLIALLKAETAEEAIHFSHEAIEMHGGNGYIEDFVTPRLLRDAQVLTVWEGTANILGLEVLRLFSKYEMDKIFLGKMSVDLGYLGRNSKTRDLVVKLEEIIGELEEELDAFRKLDSNEKTRRVKGLQKKMVVVYEAVKLLERASKGEERDIVVATIYVNHHLGPVFSKPGERWTLSEGKLLLGLESE
ncbi:MULTISPECIES: acyl-CoA dehydrogenase family protein [Bacillaceae]|uniref:Acyl-CoA dehydrogenase family protein n=1 Tax=Evansella alkalicola TaxID=745819 RepID=A0ABS6JQG5_9BACI|nr:MULTISPECIES: acyl-CoA dehydrogenase family protein [Bacillaceae]MBU9720785.1 acyl-CoA dehydrogenase family protein [Bacillus alkalicola]